MVMDCHRLPECERISASRPHKAQINVYHQMRCTHHQMHAYLHRPMHLPSDVLTVRRSYLQDLVYLPSDVLNFSVK